MQHTTGGIHAHLDQVARFADHVANEEEAHGETSQLKCGIGFQPVSFVPQR